MSETGFQQFDLLDRFDMFENPHGLNDETVSEEERQHLRMLYTTNKRYRECEAKFSPSRASVDLYFSFVSALQYIYLRNYVSKSIVKRVSLMHFPTCLSIVEFNELFMMID